MRTKAFWIAAVVCFLPWLNKAAIPLLPDPHRLGTNIEPITEAVALELDPAAQGYSGVARIELNFHTATNQFRFHAQEISLGRATLDGRELQLAAGEASIVSAISSTPLVAGRHLFEIAFTNDFNRDGTGLYKVTTAGRPYLFTQMEPIDARRAFPCWDEPAFKIPWRLTVTVPAGLEVVGNMPIAQTTSSESRKVVEFGRTPPMPSYMIALAVGAFESRAIPGQPVPGHIYTIQGRASLSELAARETPALLRELEKYFGVPYPYPKLDHVAVPEFNFGAMENPGAITYRDSFFLFDPANIGYEQRRTLLEIITHEMSHMWFGDLVTMSWWDDVWLNESFAAWMQFKIADRVHPEFRFDLLSYENITRARNADIQPSVKAIRRAFRGSDNIQEAFDALSYNKGQAILRMIEGWLGEEKFRAAIKSYFLRHRWGNARAEDLWAAFAESGDDSLSETLRRYIEQPGIPELDFTRLPGDKIEIRQRRYRTLIGKKVENQTWHVPVILRYGNAGGERTTRLLVTKQREAFAVPDLDQADWMYPNAGEASYFTWSLSSDLMTAATRRAPHFTTTERLGIINAAFLAVEAGDLSSDSFMRLLLGFTNDPEPEVRQQVVSNLLWIDQTFRPANDDQSYSKLLRKSLRPMLDLLGFNPKPNEQPQWNPLRASLLVALGINGNDSEVVAFCREMAARQFSEPRSVDAGIAGATLIVSAWNGDAEWSRQLRAALERTTAPDLRDRFLKAMIPVRNAALARSGLEYLLTDRVSSTEIVDVLASVHQPELAPVMFDWATNQYDAIKRKLPEALVGFLPLVLAGGDEALLEKGREFFLHPGRKTPHAEVEFKKAAETVSLRTALRQNDGAAVQEYVAQFGK